ncbi:MAG TPA: alpha-L-rhamnosidase [Micrococcales bacterium]|nr:alpha-L-rhamnosidase [Micrococcales bacterium]
MLATATFVTADADRGAALELLRTVTLDQPPAEVASARILATAHGVYELFLDGEPVAPDVLSPGWTSYEWRLAVQAWDVTDALRDGAARRTLSARVGNGWWRGDLGFSQANACYGEEIGLLAALEITYRDGATQVVSTGTDWSARTCDVTANNLYQGQRIDARLRGDGAKANPDHRVTPLTLREGAFDRARLVPQVAEPIRRHEELAPQRIWRSPSGATLVDFGQNLVGWLRVEVEGPAGTEITVRHAEVLEDGELGVRPLRNAAATDTFVLSGTGVDVFEPTFTFHGFRYAEVAGWPGGLDPEFDTEVGQGAIGEAIRAVVVHNAMRPTSSFSCSDRLVDRLVRNAVWGQKGNFLAVPTDCPQRDERLGWTGDIAAFAATAAFQYDAADFLHSWLLDVALETAHAGHVPIIVPDLMRHARFDGPPPFPEVAAQAIWSDAAVWVPQALWQAYGDLDRLAAHYPGMVAHLESVEPLLSETGLWDAGMQLADWLDPDAPPDQPWAAKAHPGVVATASFYRSVAFAAQAARLLGHDADAARWAALAARVRAGFRTHYVSEGAEGLRVVSDCATVYALAICFGLLDGEEHARAADRLAELVAARDHRVTTGFAGTPFVTWALSEHGHVDAAYRLLLERGCPSWLYPITMGATTIWERWDSMLPDRSINPGEMTSFNHYALGAVADWIYQVVGGIRAAEPGYRRVLVQPVPGPGIDWARTSLDARVGRIETAWRVEAGVAGAAEVKTGGTTAPRTFVLDVTLPVGVPADVVLPDGTRHEVTGGSHSFRSALPDPA